MVSDELARSVTDRAPSLVEVTAPLRSLAAVTASFLTCSVPTLFLGRLVAALPEYARNRRTVRGRSIRP
jgi:hypothetical protein